MEASKTTRAMATAGRALALFATAAIGLAALTAEPEDGTNWLRQMLLSKAVAAAAFFTLWKLYARWCKSEKWLQPYDDSCELDGKEERP